MFSGDEMLPMTRVGGHMNIFGPSTGYAVNLLRKMEACVSQVNPHAPFTR